MSIFGIKMKLFVGLVLCFVVGIIILSMLARDKNEPILPQLASDESLLAKLPPEPDFVSMVFAGDVMMDRGVRASVNKNFSGDYNKLFEKVRFMKTFDIAFANLEGPASDQGKDLKNLYSFRMDPAVIKTLRGIGIDIVSMANNHVGDWMREAFTDTLDKLLDGSILYTGGGFDKAEAETPTILERNGIKIGFLGFSDVGPIWMEAKNDEPSLPAEAGAQAGILLAGDPRFAEIVSNATKQVNYLVVSFHWGDEYKPIHNKRQEALAHVAVDNGAKLIIGHHPHVIQDTEVYKGSFIAYSLGNFMFDQSWSKPTMRGMILEVRLSKDGSMTVKKNTTEQNRLYQIENIIEGVEEKIGLQQI